MTAPPGAAHTHNGITGTRTKAETNRVLTGTMQAAIVGCPCGHGPGDPECKRHDPIPAVKGCGGCQSLSCEEIAYASRQGFYCTPSSCALAQIIGGVA